MPSEKPLSLEPEQRLIIAAKIDRLYSQDFNPQVHVGEAQEIINVLIDSIQPSSSSLTFHGEQKNSGNITGQTEHGQVDMQFENNEQRTWRTPGLHEYKIGQYILIRADSRLKRQTTLTIEHFWDRNNPNSHLQVDSYIKCETASHKVIEIGRIIPTPHLRGFFIFRKSKPLWKK